MDTAEIKVNQVRNNNHVEYIEQFTCNKDQPMNSCMMRLHGSDFLPAIVFKIANQYPIENVERI